MEDSKEPIKISDSSLADASRRLRVPNKLSSDALREARLRVRQNKFNEVEPVPIRQQFLGTEVQGRRVNSCTIASALIALDRVGEIRGMSISEKLQDLERDIVQQAVQRGDFDRGADTGISTTHEIFESFGLSSGYARNVREIEAALRAGGAAVIAYGGHARCLPEERGEDFKEFDPLQPQSMRQQKKIMEGMILVQNGGLSSNVVVAYPSEYAPTADKGENFSNIQLYSPNSPLQIDSSKYLS